MLVLTTTACLGSRDVGANPMALQRGLQKASKLLAAEVKVRARGEQSTRSISNHHSLAFIRRIWQAVAKPVESDDDIMNIAMIATGSEGARTSCCNGFGSLLTRSYSRGRNGSHHCIVLQACRCQRCDDGRGWPGERPPRCHAATSPTTIAQVTLLVCLARDRR